MIRLVDVHKTLSGRKVLDGMTLHIPKGQTTVIIGRSGVGKSVTLKHIVGLLRPDSGKVILDGQDLTSLRPRELKEVRRKCGLLFQSGALINWLTVAENVALPLIEHDHMPKARVEAIVREKLALVDMLHALEKYPSEISGGMKKRAGLARAIVRNPEVILYDEPTSGLDPVMSNQINELVLDMQSKLKVTQLVVTHDMSSAYMIADKIAMVYRGQIIAEGTPEEIRGGADPVVRQFIEGLTSGPLTDQMRSEEGAFPARPPTSSPRIP